LYICVFSIWKLFFRFCSPLMLDMLDVNYMCYDEDGDVNCWG